MFLLAVPGAGLMAGSAVIHLHLWAGSYGAIPTIGPLFLLQGVAGLVCALALILFRRVIVMVVGGVLMVSTAGGLLASHFFGLFGYRENLAVPYAGMSLVLELTGAAILLGDALLCRRWRARRPEGGEVRSEQSPVS